MLRKFPKGKFVDFVASIVTQKPSLHLIPLFKLSASCLYLDI